MRHQNSESPKQEMARLIRVIAGTRQPGETDETLRGRAARRMGINAGRAKSLWYGETDNIRSDEMDRARELAFTHPIDEAINAVETAERYIETLATEGCLGLAERVLAGLHERLARRAAADRGLSDARGDLGHLRPYGRRASDNQGGVDFDLASDARVTSRATPTA